MQWTDLDDHNTFELDVTLAVDNRVGFQRKNRADRHSSKRTRGASIIYGSARAVTLILAQNRVSWRRLKHAWLL